MDIDDYDYIDKVEKEESDLCNHSFEKPSFPAVHYLVHAHVQLSLYTSLEHGVSRSVH